MGRRNDGGWQPNIMKVIVLAKTNSFSGKCKFNSASPQDCIGKYKQSLFFIVQQGILYVDKPNILSVFCVFGTSQNTIDINVLAFLQQNC